MIKLFGSDGSFQRQVGRVGAGPGEFQRVIDVEFVEDTLIILDYTGSRITVVQPDGSVVRDWRLPIRPGRFRPFSSDSMVVASMHMTAEAIGHPFHLIVSHGEDAAVLSHFGSDDGKFIADRPFAQDVVFGLSDDSNALLRGERTRLRFEEWTVPGVHRRTITWDPEWFPEDGHSDSAAPRPLLMEFGIDSEERLWVVTHIPDRRWREVMPAGQEAIVSDADLVRYFDSRIDLFDLAKGAHLGTLVWDEPFAALLSVNGSFYLYKLELGNDLVPRIGLFRLGEAN